MTDVQLYTIEVLNELYALECMSYVPRLREADVFVSRASARDLEQLRRICSEQGEHLAWLAEAIEAAGGSVLPGLGDARSASMHYLDLRAVLPRVVASVEAALARYEQAAEDRAHLTPEARSLIMRIADRCRAHLERLRAIQAHATPAGVS